MQQAVPKLQWGAIVCFSAGNIQAQIWVIKQVDRGAVSAGAFVGHGEGQLVVAPTGQLFPDSSDGTTFL